MNVPVMAARHVANDTVQLGGYIPVPGFGMLPVNAFAIQAGEPLLVDTGLAALKNDFLVQLSAVMDPAELRWIWLTHVDADHVGNLASLLQVAPQARVVTNYLGMGKMGMLGLPLDRVCLLNPGQRLQLGDRTLLAFRPPVFDAPETMALLDEETGVCFSSDCFGSLMQSPADFANEIPDEQLQDGLFAWASVDAPWLCDVDRQRFDIALRSFENLAADVVLSSHLPPAVAMTSRLVDLLAAAVDAPAFPAPDQAALEAMLHNRSAA